MKNARWTALLASAVLASTAACATAGPGTAASPSAENPVAVTAAYPSTYKPIPAPPTLIRNARVVLTAAAPDALARIEGGSVLLQNGKIVAVGRNLEAPAGALVIDAAGKWVTPGVIDIHSHLGVYPAPGVTGHEDGNEATRPVRADVWAEHSVWPQDPQFPLALAGGVTTLQILPGSADLIGGRSVVVKNVPAVTAQAMKFPGAPYGLKMACGENPKRTHSGQVSTRMGNVAGYRAAWIGAGDYRREQQRYREKTARKEKERQKKKPGDKAKGEGKDDDDSDEPPHRDLGNETLAGVLDGQILVQNHCYRADEMATMIDVAREFGYKIAAFHHAVEAYKIADLLAANDICAAMWADWWGFKMEALDGIRENIALVEKAGACAIVHSDSAQGIQRLNQEAAKAMAAGRRIGIAITPEQAIRWITYNPAKGMGIEKMTGSLEAGKMADVVVWSGDPFSVYSRAEKVFVDGALLYDRDDPKRQPHTDFELGGALTAGAGGAGGAGGSGGPEGPGTGAAAGGQVRP